MKSKLFDALNLVSKLGPRRIANAAAILISYYISRYLGKVMHFGMPYTMSIEPTTSCNLRCPECPSGLRKFSRDTGKLSFELYKEIIDQVHHNMFYLILYFQGEPYMNPLFFKFIEYARQKRIYTATSTNAHFLNDKFAKNTIESGLDRIIISLDGTDQSTYEKYRVGGSYSKVVQGIKTLVKCKRELRSRTPYIVLQFIVFSTNEHQINEVRQLADELAVDELQLKTAQIYDYEQGNELIPGQEKFSRYKVNSDGSYRIDNSLLNHCQRMWRGCVVTWDGIVVPCCFDKDATHQLGDLKKESFQAIWKGEKYGAFRKKVYSARREIDICRNCTEK